jgi:hypothetical protein
VSEVTVEERGRKRKGMVRDGLDVTKHFDFTLKRSERKAREREREKGREQRRPSSS